jgi:hypothetical protein
MSMICEMKRERDPRFASIQGACAKCEQIVYESEFTLDDAYNVWAGKCPHCGAINLLSLNHGLRGYSSQGMHLVLPTIEERDANGLPGDCPCSGSGGEPTWHGSVSGEICHRLMNEKQLPHHGPEWLKEERDEQTKDRIDYRLGCD